MSSSARVNGGVTPVFLDDGESTAANNSRPATATLVSKEIALANQIAHAGHPVFSWYGANGSASSTLIDHTSTYRQVYLGANAGAQSEAGLMLGMQHDEASPPGFQAGQGFRVRIGGTDYTTLWNYSTSPTETWPANMRAFPLSSAFGTSTIPTELTIGGVTSDWPQPTAGSFWQNPNNLSDAASSSYIGSQDVHAGGDIVGVKTSSQQNLSTLVSVFRDTWFHQRPQIGWSVAIPGQFSSQQRSVNFSTSSQNYRYIFDQTYGTGGTSFGVGTPAVTLPLKSAGAGLRTQVRVYVFVYAAMSGATNTGSLAVANKGSSGTPSSSASALTNPVTISGTTYQWYPSLATWSASTGAYFLGYTGSAYDRVALCAKSSGAADTVLIGAFTFIVAPATS